MSRTGNDRPSAQVPGPAADVSTTVAPALRAVAAAQASHQGLLIGERGDASTGRAVGSVLGSGFRRAEATSVPITLLLLLVFGALIAAGIPLLLAVTSVVVAVACGQRLRYPVSHSGDQ